MQEQEYNLPLSVQNAINKIRNLKTGATKLKFSKLELTSKDFNILLQTVIANSLLQEKIQNIEQLDLDDNPELMQNASEALKALFASELLQNKIPVISILPNLKTLSLRNTGLNQIPREIKYFPKLEELFLDVNNISQIKEKSFLKNPKLEYISLGSNSIRSLPNSIISDSSGNRSICIVDNPLTNETIRLLLNSGLSNIEYDEPEHDETYNYEINIIDLYRNLDNYPENIKIKVLEILQENEALREFLYRSMPFTAINKKTLIKLFEKAINPDTSEDTIASMVAQIGDCSTPVKAFLTECYIIDCIKENNDINQEYIAKYALSEWIKKNIALNKNETIENVQSLLNILSSQYSNHPNNTFDKIKPIYNLSSDTEYIQYGFRTLGGSTFNSFIQKLCARNTEGDLIKQNGEYVIDEDKLNIIINEYVANLLRNTNIKSNILNYIITKIETVINNDKHPNEEAIKIINQYRNDLLDKLNNIVSLEDLQTIHNNYFIDFEKQYNSRIKSVKRNRSASMDKESPEHQVSKKLKTEESKIDRSRSSSPISNLSSTRESEQKQL